LAIHYIILIEAIALLVYFSVYGFFWLHTLYEALQLVTFVVVVYFFSLSARSLGLLHEFISRGVITVIFIVIILYVIGSVAVIIYYQDSCASVGRIMLATGALFFTLLFAYICFTMIRTISSAVKSVRKAVSKSFMLRHVRPLTSILLIYSWTSVINEALQVYLYLSATHGQDCHTVVGSNPIIEYSYPIFKQIDEILPLLAVLWYFFVTTRKDIKKKAPHSLGDVNTSYQVVHTAAPAYPSYISNYPSDKSMTISHSLHMKGYDTGLASSVTSDDN